MKKHYLSAPLPFQGQKRRFDREYIKALQQFLDGTTFVDLFGGSGLLSHIAKWQKPRSMVVYNDFDGYRLRLEHIGQTNAILTELRAIVADVPRHSAITGDVRGRVLECLRRHNREDGFLDCITLSSSLMFAMKYATTLADFERETLYNNVRMVDYPLADGYLDGLTVTSADYREIFARYKDVPGVVWLVDPPYLSTDSKTYRMYWTLADYLDVLTVLAGHKFIYFTSNKSGIVELCEWMGKNRRIGNPFGQCQRRELNARLNHNAEYTDIMLFTAV